MATEVDETFCLCAALLNNDIFAFHCILSTTSTKQEGKCGRFLFDVSHFIVVFLTLWTETPQLILAAFISLLPAGKDSTHSDTPFTLFVLDDFFALLFRSFLFPPSKTSCMTHNNNAASFFMPAFYESERGTLLNAISRLFCPNPIGMKRRRALAHSTSSLLKFVVGVILF